jgi:hypothetical protein
MELKIDNNDSNNLIIYHHNIMSLSKKRDELCITMQSILIRPHYIHLSKHHMREQEIINLSLNNYRLASSFCREEFSKGVLYIMTRNDINFNTIDFDKFL